MKIFLNKDHFLPKDYRFSVQKRAKILKLCWWPSIFACFFTITIRKILYNPRYGINESLLNSLMSANLDKDLMKARMRGNGNVVIMQSSVQ